jgi:hypothetical protein
MNKNNIMVSLIALCVTFLALQAFASFLPSLGSNHLKTVSEILRLFVVAGLLGILMPIIIGRKIELPYDRAVSRGRIMAGLAFFTGALVLEIAFFSSWFTILNTNPDDIIRFKHLLATFPLAVALTFLFFFLLPESLERVVGTAPAARMTALIIPAGALGFALYTETGFTRTDVLVVMTGVGFLAAAGHLLTDKFFLTFVTVFLAVYANSLAELRYDSFSWAVAIPGSIFCLILLAAGFYIRVGDSDTKTGEGENAVREPKDRRDHDPR